MLAACIVRFLYRCYTGTKKIVLIGILLQLLHQVIIIDFTAMNVI